MLSQSTQEGLDALTQSVSEISESTKSILPAVKECVQDVSVVSFEENIFGLVIAVQIQFWICDIHSYIGIILDL